MSVMTRRGASAATLSIAPGLCAALLAVTAAAQPAPPAATAPPADADEAGDDSAALATKVQELEDKLASLQNQQANKPFPIKITGYGDLGAFATQGDGSGFRRDIGHSMMPSLSNYGWVFYGDLLATQINSRGDVADLGQAPGVERFDSVHSG